MESRKLYPLLTYAGVLPFVGCALMPFVGLQELWNLRAATHAQRR